MGADGGIGEVLTTGHGPAVLKNGAAAVPTGLNSSVTGQWLTDNKCAFYTNADYTLFECNGGSEIYTLPHDLPYN